MAVCYVKSGAGATEFAQSTAYSLGQKIVPKRTDVGTNHLVGKRYVWECTTAGTSAGAEPTWPASVTQDVTTVTSNTAVFRARKPGFSSGTTADWSFATIYMDYPGLLMTAGDTVYVSHQHAENDGAVAFAGGTNTVALVANCSYVCVNDGAAPPTADATTATITCGTTVSAGNTGTYLRGINLIAGSGSSSNISLVSSGIPENCTFQMATTFATAAITMGIAKNCSVKFAAAGQFVTATGAGLYWSGGGLLAGGTSPTALIGGNNLGGLVEDLDLSNASAGINLSTMTASHFRFRRIKMPASWSGAISSGTQANSSYVEAMSVDNAGTNYVYRNKWRGGEGFSETTIVRTGGASDGVTPLSHKLVATSVARFPSVTCETPELTKKNLVTGTPITVTVELVHDSATPLTDKEFFIEAHYYSESGSPLGAIATSAPAYTATAAALASSSETWTTTGMSNPNKRKVSVTFTPQLKGYIGVKGFLCKASTTAYVCPKLTVS